MKITILRTDLLLALTPVAVGPVVVDANLGRDDAARLHSADSSAALKCKVWEAGAAAFPAKDLLAAVKRTPAGSRVVLTVDGAKASLTAGGKKIALGAPLTAAALQAVAAAKQTPRRRKPASAVPPCLAGMGCLCAGHARGEGQPLTVACPAVLAPAPVVVAPRASGEAPDLVHIASPDAPPAGPADELPVTTPHSSPESVETVERAGSPDLVRIDAAPTPALRPASLRGPGRAPAPRSTVPTVAFQTSHLVRFYSAAGKQLGLGHATLTLDHAVPAGDIDAVIAPEAGDRWLFGQPVPVRLLGSDGKEIGVASVVLAAATAPVGTETVMHYAKKTAWKVEPAAKN